MLEFKLVFGYIGKPEKTASSFLNNPFGEGKIYKTGDLGRWTFDGKIQIAGRVDHQIKLRGLRIELGEIENKISAISGVTACVVNKVELDGKEVLCGYYVANQDVDENEVKEFLRKSLPPYMVPSHIIRLKEMPYTINRKIDRKALPLPKTTTNVECSKKIDIADMNSNEEKLLQIWKNILKTDNISLTDNFFNIGGDSISAINMQIEALKYGLNFEYADIFNFPTIKELSKKLPKTHDDFLETYDYTKVNDVLARNTWYNAKFINKIKVRKCFAYWRYSVTLVLILLMSF